MIKLSIITVGILLSVEFLSPPQRFRHPFDGEVVIKENQGGGIFAWDGPCFGTYGQACAKRIGRLCLIWSMDKLNDKGRVHEIAHCNGWGADHDER